MKAIKKPVEVDFIQLRNDNVREVYKFVHGNYPTINCRMAEDRWFDYEDIVKSKGFELKTLESGEGYQVASIGDMIIKGVEGEFYPCKPDIFNKTYKHELSMSEEELKDEIMLMTAYRLMSEKMKKGRDLGYHGWWNNRVCSIDDIRGLYERAVEDCDYVSALNFTAMIMMREGRNLTNTDKE